MDRPHSDQPVDRTTAQLADVQDLRSVISAALTANPVDECALRRGVWTYVGAERHAGTSPGRVIMALTELVEAPRISPASVRQSLMRRVILWCVETRSPLATPDAIANEPEPFPSTSSAAPHETWFPDWRRRLTSNLTRRSDGRWAPLTRTHAPLAADDRDKQPSTNRL